MLLASFLEAHNILFENRVLTKEQVYKNLVDRHCAVNINCQLAVLNC